MYKFLLCLRYLRTRYIALASIVSVMLGVATMIVVNSVMSGFATEMRSRIQAILSDIVIETHSLDGEPNAEAQMALVRDVVGDHVHSMSATVEVFGLMHFRRGGQWIPRPITLVGIDPKTKSQVGPLIEHLDSYQTVTDHGVVIRQPLRSADVPPGWELTEDAAAYRQEWKERERAFREHWQRPVDEPELTTPPAFEGEQPPFEESPATASEPALGVINAEGQTAQDEAEVIPAGGGTTPRSSLKSDPFTAAAVETIDANGPLPARVIIGEGLISALRTDPTTNATHVERMVHPGDDVIISTVSAGRSPEPRRFHATVVDIYKSGMSEYDSNLVFCNIEELQKVRGMIDPETQERSVTSIQIKLKDYRRAKEVVQMLENAFPQHLYSVRTWEQKQGPLLAAVDIESAILNVLLFLIIAVAGFGILAIFFMIVVEKTRDIGILKSLGASSRGVMSIFLLYGLGLGLVGSGVGVGLGLLFVNYINEIEGFLAMVMGRKVFDERIYYFPSIPTDVSAFTVLWVAFGAIAIAVVASILPARRAARLHPVEALRSE